MLVNTNQSIKSLVRKLLEYDTRMSRHVAPAGGSSSRSALYWTLTINASFGGFFLESRVDRKSVASSFFFRELFGL